MSALGQSVKALAAGGLAAGLLAFAGTDFRRADAATEPPTSSATLKPVSDFDGTKDKNERAIALFREAGNELPSKSHATKNVAGATNIEVPSMVVGGRTANATSFTKE